MVFIYNSQGANPKSETFHLLIKISLSLVFVKESLIIVQYLTALFAAGMMVCEGNCTDGINYRY